MMFKKLFIFSLVFFLFQFQTVKIYAEEINVNDQNISKKLYLKIENVNAFGDYENYIKIADYLHEESIPYVIVLMPVYENTDLPEMKSFMSVIEYMQKQGGTVVLHSLLTQGYVDYQTSYQTDQVTQNDSAYEKIQKSLQVYAENGIYAVGIEATWNMINSSEYEKIKKGFSTFIEQKDKGDVNSSPNSFTTIIPDNFGTVNNDSPVNVIEANLSKLTSMKSYTEAISFEATGSLNTLKNLISTSRKEELEFCNLSDEKSQIDLDQIKITCESGRATLNGNYVSLKNPKKDSSVEQNSVVNSAKDNTAESVVNNNIKSINKFMIVAVGALCIILFIFYINGKRHNRNKFLR